MIDVRIVCAHDALKMAETLTRLLEAEQHRVRLTFGRQALSALEEARTETAAVLLIWSPNARSQTYMIEWGRNIDASRLVELACIPDCPKLPRKSPPVDFTHWRGERGRAWDALNERLRTVRRTLEPPKPVPTRTVAALGFVTAVAMVGAIGARMNAPLDAPTTDTSQEQTAALAPTGEVGGPINTFEPASIDDTLHFRRAQPIALIDASTDVTLTELADYEPQTLRNETLLELLSGLNPLRQQPSNDGGQ